MGCPHFCTHGGGSCCWSSSPVPPSSLPRGEALEVLQREGRRDSQATVPKWNLIAVFGFHCIYFDVYQLFMEGMLIS